MKKENAFEQQFFSIGREFSKIHLEGFRSRKPKKIIGHTNQVLRFYRNPQMDLFKALVGTILTWRYAMMLQKPQYKNIRIPKRECKRIEQAILRSFNYLLNRAEIGENEIIKYLRGETTPAKSLFVEANPLRKLLDLKITEFCIRFENIELAEKENLEITWRSMYTALAQKFRFRIPFSEALKNY